MKLNYKNTILVGFAFALIIAFWQAYDFLIPLMLNRTFGLSDSMRGLIMGLDNILALFLLPLFGSISDKSKSKRGRRTPFILIGTIIAVISLVFLPVVENIQANQIRNEVNTTIESVTAEQVWSKENKEEGIFTDQYNKANIALINYSKSNKLEKNEAFEKLFNGDKASNNYKEIVEPAKDNYIKQVFNNEYINENYTKKNPQVLIGFMCVLLLVLVAMAIFRSPAVALMPDVTPKPLRSQANAVINLMGGLGGGLSMIAYTILLATSAKGTYGNYLPIWIAVGAIMIVLLIVFMLTVNEPKLNKYRKDICEKYGYKEDDDASEAKAEGVDVGTLGKKKFASFLLILGAIFMWFMGHNAVNSSLSVYMTDNLGFVPATASLITMLSIAFSALAFIPVGYMATKFGRKKTILVGLVCAFVAFIVGFFVTPSIKWLFAIAWFIVTFGLIIINVNTFPMVVEMCAGSDVGKYTGWYYTATMSAQAITPFLAGLVMKYDRKWMFVYAACFMVLSFILMLFVKYGDSKPVPKKSILENFDVDD